MERGAYKSNLCTDSWYLRKKRAVEKAASNPLQTNISDYWDISVIDNIQKLLSENERLSLLLQQFTDFQGTDSSKQFSACIQGNFANILRQFFLNAQKNEGQCSTHRRYPPILKKFATVVFILAGPMAYELIQQNMPQALPGIRTVQGAIHSEYKTIPEGYFRFDELRQHIDCYNAPLCVSIAEDATRIVGKVDYDNETNRCVGFVLPLDHNGLPKGDSFIASSFAAIHAMFQNNSVAKYAYVYMAQSLANNVPAFCLACMGTDNKFIALSLMQRWKYIVTECNKRNIAVVSFGGDGDSRIMKCMKVSSTLFTQQYDPYAVCIPSDNLYNATSAIPNNWAEWFFTTDSVPCFVQDTVHVAVKLKSRLLKPQIVLPMGNYFADSHHLHTLRSLYGKDKHGLRLKDVNHKDKQNFQAVINITNTLNLLSHIPQASGTRCYVKIIKYVIDSYLDKSIEPLQRIEKSWYAIFVLRYWRKWIILNSHYTLRDNFITSNAYCGVELNGHALINFLRMIRDNGNSSSFTPWLLGSQTCESTFRAVRSMSTVFSTVINFGMLGLLRRLHRLHIQLVIQAETKEDIVFPRVLKHEYKHAGRNLVNNYVLTDITDDDIYQVVKKAQAQAKLTIEELGMANLFSKHLLDNEKIPGIDGGREGNAEQCEDEEEQCEDEEDEYTNDNKPSDEEYSNHRDCIAQMPQETSTEEVAVISSDLDKLSEHNVIESQEMKQLEKHHQFKRLLSDTIPMYERVETQNKELRKHHGKQFSPFVELEVSKSKSVFIRKTTVVWLFQEGERVSIDRLFRVWHKQPFSTTDHVITNSNALSLINTSINDISCAPVSAVICNDAGSIIVSNDTSSTCAPRTTVISNDAGSTVVSNDTSSTCAPVTTGICTFNKDDINSVTTYAANKLLCTVTGNVCSSSSDNSDIVNLTCLDDDGDAQDNRDVWVKIGRMSLLWNHQHMILKGEWLCDTHMNAVQLLLKSEFPQINGLMNTVGILQKGVKLVDGSIQILHVNSNHWITVSTMQSSQTKYDITVYDSSNSHLSEGVKVLLANLIRTPRKRLQIRIANVVRQAGYNDCGVFAAAYCTALANGQDPVTFVYNQSIMRKHLEQCLSNAKLMPFPVIKARRGGNPRYDEVDVYCLCRSVDDGSPMVCCDKCTEWFHLSCVNAKVITEDRWYCQTCS